MNLLVATGFDQQTQDEVLTPLAITPELAIEEIRALLDGMEYRERQSWIRHNQKRGMLSVRTESPST